MSEQDHVEVLKKRLASGEISIEEYRALLAEISQSVQAPRGEAADLGQCLVPLDEFAVYENGLKFKWGVVSYEKVIRVLGGVSRSLVNGVTTSKDTRLSIGFEDGKWESIKEGSTWFKRKRHAAIVEAYRIVREKSFPFRWKNFVARLQSSGEVLLAENGWKKNDPVKIYSDGSIGNSKFRFSIAHARYEGTLMLGVSRMSASGGGSSSPNEIVISDKKKPPLLAVPFRRKISFEPVCEDLDVVFGIIDWFSDPKNQL